MADHEQIWGAFEDCFKLRRWRAIRTSWPEFMGRQIEPAGCRPETTLSELLEQGGIFFEVPQKGKLTSLTHPRAEIPETVFREAVYWLHKALHVLGASEEHVDSGLPSWSLSAAYQSTYFAARSIMAFFGVTVSELRKVSVSVDLCRDMRGIKPQRMQELGAFGEEAAFHSIGVLFDHRQVWQLFQHILRTSSCTLWPDGWANYFANLDVGNFTSQRHGLHYHVDYWVLDDLHDFLFPDNFANLIPTGAGRELFNSDSPNFSLVIGANITRMALKLFDDLCPLTNRLKAERTLILRNFSIDRHPFFAETLRHIVASA